MNPPAAITFDFWGTLFADHGDGPDRRVAIRVDAFAVAAGVERREAQAAHEAMGRAFMRHHIEQKQTLTPADGVRMMCESCGVALGESEFLAMTEQFATAILDAPPEPIAECVEAVRDTAARVPIAIISDAGISPGSSLRVLLDRAGILDCFTTTVFSDEVGVAKPQRPMFAAAAEGLGVGIDSLLHIGDLEPTDIDGAIAVGSQAGLFTGHQDKYLSGTRAHHHFPSWSMYRNWLASL